jgi:hypothetical protein
MPTIADLDAWLRGAGFAVVQTEVVERQKALDVHAELQAFQERPSVLALAAEALTTCLAAMQEEWQRQQGQVVDPRLTRFIVGQKRRRSCRGDTLYDMPRRPRKVAQAMRHPPASSRARCPPSNA